MTLQESLELIQELNNQTLELQQSFLKHLVSLSSALIVLLLALNEPSPHSRFLFLLGALLLLLCILLGVVAQVFSLAQLHKMNKELRAEVSKQIRDGEPRDIMIASKYNNLRQAIEIACLVCFVLAMIDLTVYAFLIY